MEISWQAPIEAAIKNRETIKELLEGGLAAIFGKSTSIAFTGMEGVGKTVLLDHLTGKALKIDYQNPDQSQKVEKGKIRLPGQRLKISVVPGQDANPRLVAIDDLFSGKKPVEGVVHTVAFGFASIRNADIQNSLIKNHKMTTFSKLNKYLLDKEFEDLASTCQAIRDAHRKYHKPMWLILAVDKIDLYYSKLDGAREYYCKQSSRFAELLNRLKSHVGEDYFRWQAVPVCSCLESYEWNGKERQSQLNQNVRDAYLSQLIKLLKNYGN